jgi:predicted O-methyltransferase YrrM
VTKPLFDGEWAGFSPFDRAALAQLIVRARRPRCHMAEVGSWLGDGSTQVFTDLLRDSAATVYCIDTWLGSANVPRHRALAEAFDVRGTFDRNIARGKPLCAVVPIQAASLSAASRFSDRSLDLVFLDADHSYEATIGDIRAWAPKVRPGGILSGHDCEFRAPEIGLDFLNRYRDADAIEAPHTFRHMHPGCMLAVHEVFEDKVSLCSDRTIRLEDDREGRATIWYVEV